MRGKDERVRQVLVPGADAASNERDELWEVSVRRDQELKRRDLDAKRYEYHAGRAERLRRTMTQLVEHHERAAEKLLEGNA